MHDMRIILLRSEIDLKSNIFVIALQRSSVYNLIIITEKKPIMKHKLYLIIFLTMLAIVVVDSFNQTKIAFNDTNFKRDEINKMFKEMETWVGCSARVVVDMYDESMIKIHFRNWEDTKGITILNPYIDVLYASTKDYIIWGKLNFGLESRDELDRIVTLEKHVPIKIYYKNQIFCQTFIRPIKLISNNT